MLENLESWKIIMLEKLHGEERDSIGFCEVYLYSPPQITASSKVSSVWFKASTSAGENLGENVHSVTHVKPKI